MANDDDFLIAEKRLAHDHCRRFWRCPLRALRVFLIRLFRHPVVRPIIRFVRSAKYSLDALVNAPPRMRCTDPNLLNPLLNNIRPTRPALSSMAVRKHTSTTIFYIYNDSKLLWRIEAEPVNEANVARRHCSQPPEMSYELQCKSTSRTGKARDCRIRREFRAPPS